MFRCQGNDMTGTKPTAPYPDYNLVSRQHAHWGETAVASWMRTSIITFAAALAANKFKGKASQPPSMDWKFKGVMFVAWFNMLLAAAVWYVRGWCRVTCNDKENADTLWANIKQGEDVACVIDGFIIGLYVLAFLCLLITYMRQ